MKKHLFIPLVCVAFASCHESIEDKAERETKDFTQKNCPVQVAEGVVNDSMTFDRDTRTINYFYSMTGAADTTAIDTKRAKEELVKGIKNATSLRNYKEKGFNFAYTYFSTKHKGKVLIHVKITPSDYEDK